MPRGDGTGPMGRGALTGRGLGSCAGASVPLYGMGYGRGMGRGAGLGYGCRRGARFFWDTAGPQTDRGFLDTEKDLLQKRLAWVEEQLKKQEGE